MEFFTTLILIAVSIILSIYMVARGIAGCLKILRIDKK